MTIWNHQIEQVYFVLKGQESSSDAQKVGLLAETMAKAGWSFTQTKPGQSGAQNRRNYSTSTSRYPGRYTLLFYVKIYDIKRTRFVPRTRCLKCVSSLGFVLV